MKSSPRSLLMLVLLVLGISLLSTWWAGQRERRIGHQVAALAQPGDIRMLSSDSCGVCVIARDWLREHGVAFSECSIERDAACRQDFEASRAPGTPVIVVRGQPQLGFSVERLRGALTPRT